ncbi:NUDIX domain-containing protein [Ornithinibacillus sp. L9]|uniref:NUDIX domain-containing protein n=1 Tax=Ornithinibacillus caprae TaxID=2678566 RepID=A0A6N8FJM7_9BACI|nr:NUDIX hydrolase [Ornithinibacillus caprae]MUK87959.1 NUDIX domain-containing protein [Ornithinibacillus caprae]
MKEWYGSAAICVSEDKKLLMVRGAGSDVWAVPSGGIEKGETPEECCVREVKEETGYDVEVIKSLFVKETEIKGINVKTYYFEVKKIGTSAGIKDPDNIIVEVDWKSHSELQRVKHVYTEDKSLLLRVLG